MAAVLGIGGAKETLVVALLGSGTPRKRSFPNTPAGHQELLNWLSKQHLSETPVCLEATQGWYSLTYYQQSANAL
jgi:hypothetical protein